MNVTDKNVRQQQSTTVNNVDHQADGNADNSVDDNVAVNVDDNVVNFQSEETQARLFQVQPLKAAITIFKLTLEAHFRKWKIKGFDHFKAESFEKGTKQCDIL